MCVYIYIYIYFFFWLHYLFVCARSWLWHVGSLLVAHQLFSCGMRAPQLWLVGSLVVACELSAAACMWDPVP